MRRAWTPRIRTPALMSCVSNYFSEGTTQCSCLMTTTSHPCSAHSPLTPCSVSPSPFPTSVDPTVDHPTHPFASTFPSSIPETFSFHPSRGDQYCVRLSFPTPEHQAQRPKQKTQRCHHTRVFLPTKRPQHATKGPPSPPNHCLKLSSSFLRPCSSAYPLPHFTHKTNPEA